MSMTSSPVRVRASWKSSSKFHGIQQRLPRLPSVFQLFVLVITAQINIVVLSPLRQIIWYILVTTNFNVSGFDDVSVADWKRVSTVLHTTGLLPKSYCSTIFFADRSGD